MSGGAGTTLSEAASKALLGRFGVPLAPEHQVETPDQAVAAADELGYPVVAKLGGDGIAHKTERGLVRLNLGDAEAVRAAATDLLAAATPDDGAVHVLVAPMVKGTRELIAGLHDDAQFGMTVMLGVGGILAEAVADVSIRLVPITRVDAEDMIDGLATQALLGPFRGEPAVDRDALVDVLVGLSAAAEADPRIASADLNPLIIVDGKPIAVDALVELGPGSDGVDGVDGVDPSDERDGADGTHGTAGSVGRAPMATSERFRALFEPRGVVVAGASSHPGKFGFVALHNILAAGFEGPVYATNREGIEVLGVKTLPDFDDVPDGVADLIFVCTPAATNADLLRAAAAKGITAAFIASAGYGEAGDEGKRAQDDLVTLADELGMLIVGPNGQGVVSTPASLCAQIVAPYPPRGRIGIASQSGNFVSSFMNYAIASGVGISRAVSAGNAAQVGVADFLEFYADDPETDVALAYVEGVADGRTFYERLRRVCEKIPVVLVKGGATAGGARAAASHTGSLATDDRVFDGMCRQAGAVRAASIEEAYEAAATFATQPLPGGPNVVVVSTAGGWGVVTADAIHRSDLELMAMPEGLTAELDTKLPPRWSRNNPVDLAGGETKDTIPDVLATTARWPGVDAIVFLGMGIQGNVARMERDGPFYPDHGLERIVGFHERQEERYTATAAELTAALGKPILTATELATAMPDNAAVQGVMRSGKYCYPSSNRAVIALGHLWQYARWRRDRAL